MRKLLYIDLFCGAGGTSTGVEAATLDGQKCAHVIACVNHDPHAIASHLANHPEAKHYTEDIRTLDLTTLVEHASRKRAENPGALLVLWASLECTNFSKAKGGQPRDADSRTLAEHLFRYIDALDPDYIQIENVREFMMWGDLDENGKPVSRDAGRLYLKWVGNVCRFGYNFAHRILNAADFGAYTSRERFFGIFAKDGLPIVFPEPTHSRNGSDGLFGTLRKWKPVGDVLDLDDEGRSIFDPARKPLAENALKRIYAGLVKFVAGGKGAYEARKGSACAADGLDSDVHFIDKQYGTGTAAPLSKPAATITTNPKLNLVSVKPWIMDTNFGNVGRSIDEPSRVITANRKWHYLVNPQFASAGSGLDRPCFTLIARMDKRPPYVVTAQDGPGVTVNESDSPMTVKIKEFMSAYGICDIFIRMLKIVELKRIMGFGDDYVLVGTTSEQKKYIGNAVETHVACALAASLAKEINR